MRKTIQFDREPGQRTVKIENVLANRMLSAEFESGKTARPQSTPKLLFFPGLLASKAARVGRGIHQRHDTSGYAWEQGKRPPLPSPLLLRRRGGWPRTGPAYFMNFKAAVTVGSLSLVTLTISEM